MRRRSLWIGFGLCLLLLSLVVGGVVFAAHRVPTFHREAEMPAGPTRLAQSREFVNRYTNLVSSIYNRYPDWGDVFTSEQVNAFLQEDFRRAYGGDENLPENLSDLRVRFEKDRLYLGCRYGSGWWSTVFSVEVKVWLVADEVNVVGLELMSLKAGAVPLSPQWVIDSFTHAADRANIDVSWYRRDGNPVAILKLQANQLRPTIQILRLDLLDDQLVIVGRSTEPAAGAVTPKVVSPAGKP